LSALSTCIGILLLSRSADQKGIPVNISAILLIVLILMLVGVLPIWPHSAHWGYFPSGGLGILLIVVVVLLVTGRA
jgi:drug/metabolite transporter (DMT)-like permease